MTTVWNLYIPVFASISQKMASLIEVHNPVLIASDNIELKILTQNITDDINVLEFKKNMQNMSDMILQ